MTALVKKLFGKASTGRVTGTIRGILCLEMASLLLLASLSHAQQPPPPSAATTATKNPGKGISIQQVDRDTDGKIAWIKIRMLSDTPVKETWVVVGDVDQWARCISLIPRIEPMKSRGADSMYRIYGSPPWPFPDVESVVRVRKSSASCHLSYWIEEGFMEGTYGNISVSREASGCWLIYDNYGPHKIRFPGWMVKIGVYIVLPSILKDLHAQILEVVQAQETL